jgi:hypothetical protein
LTQVAATLSDAYRDPRDVLFGRVHGAHAGHLAIGQPDRVGRPADPFALLPFRRAPLILNASHPLVAAARAQARESVVFAADILARAVLSTHDALNAARSEHVLDDTLDALTKAPRASRGKR